MTKSVYSEPAPPMEHQRTEKERFENSLTYRLLQPPSALIEPYDSRVVIKESGVLHTKGYQIKSGSNTQWAVT